MGIQQSAPCAPCGSKARVAEPVSASDQKIKDDFKKNVQDWNIYGAEMYKACQALIKVQPDFTGDFFAKYYSQLGVRDRSDVGQQYGGETTFHECFFSSVSISLDPPACEIMGSTQDLKLLELASAVFSMNIEHFSKNAGLEDSKDEVALDPFKGKHGAGRGPRFGYFDNLNHQYYNFQAWFDSTNIGKKGKETQWLLAELWMQTVVDYCKTDMALPDHDKSWANGVHDLWKVYRDDDGKFVSDWLQGGPFFKSQEEQMAAMIGLSRYYCNDIADRPDPPVYMGTANFDDAPSRSGQYNPPNRLFLSDWKVTDRTGPAGTTNRNICTVEVDSDYVDPGFKLDIWRPDNEGYIHVYRIDMPLVKGTNRKVVAQATNCRPGDVIGWWSSTRSEVKYAQTQEAGNVSYVDDFTTTDLSKKVSFTFKGSFTDRAFSIRIMSDSDTWLKMQQAVRDCFPDKADTYLSLARRTHFEDTSKITGIGWKNMEDSCSQKAIFTWPFPPAPLGLHYEREDFTYQELIRHFCVYLGSDDVILTYSQETCLDWEPPASLHGQPYCRKWGSHRKYDNHYGKLVRQWLAANKAILLKNGEIGDWVNVIKTEVTD